jgi:cobalamin biosynthetic protein CobC
MLNHGGRLRQAAGEYAIPFDNWLDLSTGINPEGWPIPDIPPAHWARLPELDDGLEAAAQAYYGVEELLPVAGSQAAIQSLPHLRPISRVGLVHPSYAEHHYAWHRAGHHVVSLDEGEIARCLPQLDVLILVRPNNPDGTCHSLENLLSWHEQLAHRGGWLVVDEAFVDPTPGISLLRYHRPGLIVLRSLGKFFGLAGARVGFVNGPSELLDQLAELLGPWSISGPARWVASAALKDRDWQAKTRQHLPAEESRLRSMLKENGLSPKGGCALFQWIPTRHAKSLHHEMARCGILTRLFQAPSALRIGLPGHKKAWARLAASLPGIMEQVNKKSCLE